MGIIEISAVHTEEVKNSKRDFPRALYYSALIVVASSALSSTAIALVAPKAAPNIMSGGSNLCVAFAIFIFILGSFVADGCVDD